MSSFWWERSQSWCTRLRSSDLTLTHGRGSGTSPFREGLDSLLLWSCRQWEAAGRASDFCWPAGLLTVSLEFTLVSERVASLSALGWGTDPDWWPKPQFSVSTLFGVRYWRVYLLRITRVHLGDFNAHVGIVPTWGVVYKNTPPPLIWTQALFFCWNSVLVTDCP